MALGTISPAEMDQIGDIKSETRANSNGVLGDVSETTHHSNVRSSRITALRTGAGDQGEALQTVGKETASWVMRKEDRMTGANKITRKMFYEVDGVKHYIRDIRVWKGSRNFIVLDTIAKDNE